MNKEEYQTELENFRNQIKELKEDYEVRLEYIYRRHKEIIQEGTSGHHNNELQRISASRDIMKDIIKNLEELLK